MLNFLTETWSVLMQQGLEFALCLYKEFHPIKKSLPVNILHMHVHYASYLACILFRYLAKIFSLQHVHKFEMVLASDS